MQREELLELHSELTRAAKWLMVVKNRDYASDFDPFRNFRRHGLIGINVRLSDKLSRLDNFEEKGVFAVSDESLKDTLIDIINYAVLYYGYVIDRNSALPPRQVGDVGKGFLGCSAGTNHSSQSEDSRSSALPESDQDQYQPSVPHRAPPDTTGPAGMEILKTVDHLIETRKTLLERGSHPAESEES